MRYQWIFFDADGTLYDFEKAEINALEKTFRHFNHPYNPAHIDHYKEINEILWTQFENGSITQDEIVVKRFSDFFSHFNIKLNAASFNQQYLHNLGSEREFLPGAANLLKKLYGNINMLLITNGVASVQRNRFNDKKVASFFKHVVISEEVGAAKPDPRIFEAAFELAGYPPKDGVLMVGDSPTADIKGANVIGIDACWYNPSGIPHLQSELDIKYEIKDLIEILKIIGI